MRCINLDWLEVFCREPIETKLDSDYYRSIGYVCHDREYGTRVYREMFTIEGADGQPFLEIRRNPASTGLKGLHTENECHIRLTNRTCYFDNAAELLSQFLATYGYSDIRISRVDICLDFVLFDKGDEPKKFISRYFKHRYAKINQGNISSHGEDKWSGQEWNSLSWGSKSSPISTKLYNKTLELYDVKTDSFKKPWIRQAWAFCGMVDDWQNVTKDNQKVDVFRLEFSIRSSVKNWVRLELNGTNDYQSIRNNLDCYLDRSKMLVIFASLCQHYFRFKVWDANKRKDRCKDKVLFDFNLNQSVYKIGRNNYAAGNNSNHFDNMNRLISKIEDYRRGHMEKRIHDACNVIIEQMQKENMQRDLADSFSRDEIEFMRRVIRLSSTYKDWSVEFCMRIVRKEMGINDNTLPIF